ncbi:MAG: FAD-dependent oxidoreductase [Spirochaetaceae bacterium]|nr:MAG: FAD-dependent oxidoreductase [Spirochaetaceae bacterium]
MSDRVLRVAVVGAGIAGLTARSTLRRAGFAVDTFEKGRGPGGRISRRRAGEYQFDHGTQYFTAHSPLFSALAQRWVADGVAAVWQPRIGILQDGQWTARPNGPRRFVGVPGMNEPAKALAAEVDGAINYECRIQSITRESETGWILRDTDETQYEGYDWVVVTTPPVQVLQILQLPSPVRPILGGAVVDPCWAVMAVFEPDLQIGWDAAFVQKGPLSWVARNNSKPGRPEHNAWVLHATAEWSRRFVENEKEWAAEQLVAAFFDALGRQPQHVVWSAAHRWRYARPRTQLPDRYWWDPAIGLGLCGDWCIGGRVESAFTSARLLSEDICGRTGAR